jgi:hypothetical protein
LKKRKRNSKRAGVLKVSFLFFKRWNPMHRRSCRPACRPASHSFDCTKEKCRALRGFFVFSNICKEQKKRHSIEEKENKWSLSFEKEREPPPASAASNEQRENTNFGQSKRYNFDKKVLLRKFLMQS